MCFSPLIGIGGGRKQGRDEGGRYDSFGRNFSTARNKDDENDSGAISASCFVVASSAYDVKWTLE